jgi:hypothetical protein
MGSIRHKIYITALFSIVVFFVIMLYVEGHSYYSLSLDQRSFHSRHVLLKPSGLVGHGLGVIGTLLIIIGVFSYMIRKKVRRFSRLGVLRNWLEFHIFLCTLGPLLILYHTAFKFGGIVAVSFWSMVAVFLSGIVGRYIYIHIPRTIEGRELSISEISNMRNELSASLRDSYHIDESIIHLMDETYAVKPEVQNRAIIFRLIAHDRLDREVLRNIKTELREHNFTRHDYNQVITLCKKEISLSRRIDLLVSLQNLFRHWHVVHLPFAMIMLVITIVHVVVAVLFGYRWIF